MKLLWLFLFLMPSFLLASNQDAAQKKFKTYSKYGITITYPEDSNLLHTISIPAAKLTGKIFALGFCTSYSTHCFKPSLMQHKGYPQKIDPIWGSLAALAAVYFGYTIYDQLKEIKITR